MVIEAYSGFSKKPNSTKQPSGSGTSITCRIKDNCSVLNPVFLLNAYNLSHNYVKWGSRYYYIDDIVIVGNELAEYHCSTDVMATFKGDIIASSQYVARSAAAADLTVMDSRYPTKAQITPVSEPISFQGATIDYEHGTYVIGLKSKMSNNGLAYYSMSESDFADFCSYLYSDAWIDITDLPASIQKMLSDPFDYVVSCMYYPFSVTGSNTSVYFGYFDWTGHQMSRINEANRMKTFVASGTLPTHPQVARGSFLNAAPYTRMWLDLYCFGKVALDPNYFLNSRAYSVSMLVDLFTGIGTCKVESTNGEVYKASATVGIPVQLSQIKNDLSRPLIEATSIAASLAVDNYVGAAAGIADAVSSAMPQISSIGSVGSVSSYAFNPPNIEVHFYHIVEEDLAQIGRPLCAVRTISSLSGYIECDNADLDTAASPAEKTQIMDYMNRGFYNE